MKKISVNKLEKLIYQIMKIEAKERGYKLSAEQNLYKKEGEYFYSSFYAITDYTEDKIQIIADIGVKYWRFDELKESIVSPDAPVRFTDKIRANSLAMCPCYMPRKTIELKWDGLEDSLNEICSEIMDFIIEIQRDFVSNAEKNYGGLDKYYINNEEEFALLAGLSYLEIEKYEDAIRCFSSEKMGLSHKLILFSATTEEQVERLKRDGIELFEYDGCYQFAKSEQNIFIDYALTKMSGEKWSADRMKYGKPLDS